MRIPTEDFTDVALASADTDEHDDQDDYGDHDDHDDNNNMMKVYLVFSVSVCSGSVFSKVFLASQDALEVMGVTHWTLALT